MTDRWGFYFQNADGQPLSLNVNLGLIETAPDAAHPWLGSFLIRMMETNEHGFPTAAEYGRITEVEGRAVAIVKEAADVVFTGVVTGAGGRQVVFYGSDEAALRSALESAAAEQTDYTLTIPPIENDAEWGYYREFLYPGDEDMQSIDNRDAAAGLQRYGDDLSQPRIVTHWAYFAQADDRDAFAREIASGGFELENTDQDSGEQPYGVKIEREDRVDFRSIDKLTLPLYRAALRHNGEYDGWECPVIAANGEEEQPA
jgi:uncharacterized protein (TIGR01619 family)